MSSPLFVVFCPCRGRSKANSQSHVQSTDPPRAPVLFVYLGPFSKVHHCIPCFYELELGEPERDTARVLAFFVLLSVPGAI